MKEKCVFYEIRTPFFYVTYIFWGFTWRGNRFLSGPVMCYLWW